DLAGRATVVGSADGRTAWVLAPEADDRGRHLRVRCVTDGKLTADTVVPLAGELAGRPVALGRSVLIPVANGYVYRFTPGDSQLMVGPLWRGDASGEKPQCYLTPLGADEFLATNGGRRFLRWRWPVGMKHEKAGGYWEAREPIAVPVAVVGPADRLQFLSLDVTGMAFLFDADKPGTVPVRRWHGGGDKPKSKDGQADTGRTDEDKPAIPPGKPAGPPITVAAGGRTLVVYSIEGKHLVALDPAQAEPAWVRRELAPPAAGALIGWNASGSRLIVTDQAGQVIALDAATGKDLARSPVPPAGTIAVAPAIPLGAGALVVLADGSAATVPLPSAGPND
ncbi:MAG TPA: PQQ-binding-like beta-propeller repeat protein, partial [Fimbriiglobus sp.]|nr:PQQ-binding-like beta-propeller repeat protein [Fimbriiglobus sp.]